MQTLTVETTVTQPKAVEIPIPFFARTKDESEYLGLLDEKTLVKMFIGTNFKYVTNSTVSISSHHDLAVAWENWVSATETEFFEKYHAVIESMSIHPILAV